MSLNRDDIKDKLISVLKTNEIFKDFDYRASGINILLDVLTKNAEQIGLYNKFTLDESSIQSAKTRESLIAHANDKGYIPRGVVASQTDIRLDITIDKDNRPQNNYITIDKGSTIQSVNSSNDKRTFIVNEPVTVYQYKENTDGSITFTTPMFTLFEGSLTEWKSKVDYNILDQRFIIKDDRIDIETLRVYITPPNGNNTVEYRRVNSLIDVNSDDQVFYVRLTPYGYYEFYFGNDIIGKRPDDQSIITATYIHSSGERGNGANRFNYDGLFRNIKASNIDVLHSETSYGGAEHESNEELRYILLNYDNTIKTLLTADDYKNAIIKIFKDIESINAWNGADNHIKQYGKTFISIKPLYSDRLTTTAKRRLKELLERNYSVIADDIVFVDPSYVDIDINVLVDYNPSQTINTQSEVEAIIYKRIEEYNMNALGSFDNMLSESRLTEYLRNNDEYIRTIRTTKRMRKTIDVVDNDRVIYDVIFGNPIDELKPIQSESFYYGKGSNAQEVRYVNDGRNIILVNNEGEQIINEVLGTVDFTTGIISFRLPPFTDIIQGDYNVGQVEWMCFNSELDIYTYNNNIIRIGDIIVESYDSGGHK